MKILSDYYTGWVGITLLQRRQYILKVPLLDKIRRSNLG